MFRNSVIRFARNTKPQSRLLALGFMLVFAGLGTYLLVGSHAATSSLPNGVTLQQIDGGPSYWTNTFGTKSPNSTWLDSHVLLGAWMLQPINSTEVGYDTAMGSNLYFSPAGTAGKDRVGYTVMKAGGMHAFASDYFDSNSSGSYYDGGNATLDSGTETVGFAGRDETDMKFGPGSAVWLNNGSYSQGSGCQSGAACGYSRADYFYSGNTQNVSFTSTNADHITYPTGNYPVYQNMGKGVLFWESDPQASQFNKYADVLSADAYWLTDPDLQQRAQGGCALLPNNSAACGTSGSLTQAQSRLPANYEYNIKRQEYLQNYLQPGSSKPVLGFVETGCPFSSGSSGYNLCATPAAFTAAAWHSIIAGARGIDWFQHNFSGPCFDFNTFYDGSNPNNATMYNCQQTPGVTLHDVVTAVTAFNKEAGALSNAILAPFANGFVQNTTGTVSTMTKYDASGNQFYLFAGSGKPGTPPAANQNVTFTVAGSCPSTITVYNENRTLTGTNGQDASGNPNCQFSDMFADQNSVHIYQLGNGTVGTPTTPSISSFTATPTTITSGQSTSLSWATANASSCSASGAWSGNEPTSGTSVSVTPPANTGSAPTTATYTLTCSGSAGTTPATASVSVTVNPVSSGNTNGSTLVGDATIETGTDNDSAGDAEAFRYNATASGTASTLNVYLANNNASTNLLVGLYADNGGHPGTLLASGSNSSLHSGAWNAFTLNSNPTLASGSTYWITLLSTSGNVYFAEQSQAAANKCSENNATTGITSLPATWTSGASYFSCNASAYVTAASTATPPDTTPPSVSLTAPTSGATVSGTTTLSANASDASGIASVEFDINGNQLALITSAPYSTAWDTTSLTNGAYTITVKATDTAGNVGSTSTTVTVNNPDRTPPTAPTNLTGTAVSPTQVNLSWTASTDSGPNASGVKDYQVERGGIVIATVAAPATTYTDTSAAASTSYSYTVIAEDNTGNTSTPSNTINVTTPTPPDTTPPSAPTALTASATSNNQVNLAWNSVTDPSGIKGYTVYRNGTKLTTSYVSCSTTVCSYGDGTVSAGTTYSYTVTATDGANNESAQSSAASVTTPPTVIIGTNTIQSNSDSDVSGQAEAFKTTATTTSSVSAASIYLGSANKATKLSIGIYGNSGNNLPGNLLVSASTSLTSSNAGSWVTVNLPKNVSVTSGSTYWIAVLGTGGNLNISDGTSGTSVTSTSTKLTNLPSKWNGSTTYHTGPVSAYFTK